MSDPHVLADRVLASWATNCRVTEYLLENVPDEVWTAKVPEVPRKTVRMIASHLHNNRCAWIARVGEPMGVQAPGKVDRRSVDRARLLEALRASSDAMTRVLRASLERGGALPDFPWRNLPLDVVHLLTYHMAHEAHHRGQIVMIARQLGRRLPNRVTDGLWQWAKRSREAPDFG